MNKDCTKAPRVVTSSLTDGQGVTWLASVLSAWHAAGIIPVFANGDRGTTCGTATSPSDLPKVITVGATDAAGALASFSRKGPSVTGLVKPDLSAPGVGVVSASSSGIYNYGTRSGTSTAAAHVAGVVALLLSKNPSLTFDQVRVALTDTTDRSSLTPTGFTCGGTDDTTFPNNQYGYGRINAAAAITRV